MLVNPGGPGFGGTSLPENADSYFSTTLIDTFDIIGWDPRGTGESTPAVDCVDNYDTYFTDDPSPETEAEHQALIDISKAFNDECEKKSGEFLPYISTNSTARDMDMIRAALGEEKITYFGFSYGSELGATWATMFPSTVRAAVFDGATDPTSNYMQGGLDQAKGFETEFTKFLAQCSANKKCPFYNNGNSEGAFDTLIKELDERPLLVSKNRTLVNQGVAYTAVSQAMYSSTMWAELEIALADAQKGDGAGLLGLFDSYYQRTPDGKYGNELEAFNAILCLDDPGPTTVEETDSYIPQFLEVAPRLGISFTGGYTCVFWPAKPDPRIEITGKGAGPIIVVGTTGDAATPLASSRKMASALEDGRLIVVSEDRHTGYGANDCVVSAVDNYLITTKVSFAEKAC
jgi:pimeloyl-ACP methyl ester carboxylesterase